MKQLTPLILLLFAAPATACGGLGGLGQSTISTTCTPGDARCTGAGLAAPIAVGATIRPRIDLAMRGSGSPLIALESSRPDILAANGDALTGVAPGMAAVRFTNETGTVMDIVHLWVAAPTRISIEQLDVERRARNVVDDGVSLIVGEQLLLGSAIYAGAQRLAGDGGAEWTVEGPAVAILHDGASGRRRLVARAAGKATLTIAAHGLTTTLELEVMP